MVIEGRELSLIYDVNKEAVTYALRDVDVSIGSGVFTAITGPSGSGKSSLLYLLSGLRKPTTGTVYYDDVDIESYSSYERDTFRRSRFGFVFQKHFLVGYLTVLDNILLVPNINNDDTRQRALMLLEQLGIRQLAGKKPCQLSNGQRQLTAIARALINKPAVVFADEPTASLDHSNAMEIMHILKGLNEASSIVFVTHDRSLLDYTDTVIELRDGRRV